MTGSESLMDEYLWSLVESATAILCACAVTYRPLFTNFGPSPLRRLSSRLGRNKDEDSGHRERRSDEPEHDLQYQWPPARGLRSPMTYQDMYARVTKHNVHVLNVALDGARSQNHTENKQVTVQPVKGAQEDAMDQLEIVSTDR